MKRWMPRITCCGLFAIGILSRLQAAEIPTHTSEAPPQEANDGNMHAEKNARKKNRASKRKERSREHKEHRREQRRNRKQGLN